MGEDDLVRPGRPDESGHPVTHLLEAVGRLLTDGMDSAGDVRRVMIEILGHRLTDRPRLEGGGGVVEIRERHASNLAREHREIGGDLSRIPRDQRVRYGGDHRLFPYPPAPRRAVPTPAGRSPTRGRPDPPPPPPAEARG